MNKNCPVLVIFFNRPVVFKRQLESLKKFKPTNLYFSADGAGSSNLYDVNALSECKNLISKIVDWDCNINFFYAEKNHGCDQFVPMAINWFFLNVESGIILEDDCLISEDFFKFAAYLLNKYSNQERVMNISASNFQQKRWGNSDYYFSRYPANWGWATWRRAWQYFNTDLDDFDCFVSADGSFSKIQLQPDERRYWLRFFKSLKVDKYTFWDAKWLYAIWKRNGISITPNFNLSTNIGYGETATHTKQQLKNHNLPIHVLSAEINDPDSYEIQSGADNFLYHNFYKPTVMSRLRSMIKIIKKNFL